MRFVLVYQGGIANVFEVQSFNLADYGRNAKRVYQGDFYGAYQFCHGAAAAGGIVHTAACNLAGDVRAARWTTDLDAQPFADKLHRLTLNTVGAIDD